MDDAIAVTRGDATGVVLMHAWVTKRLISWVNLVLRKDIALHKLQIVAPHRGLRAGLKAQLGRLGKHVSSRGELLGTDFTAGAAAKTRPMVKGRLKKARRRKGKLRWFRRNGGSAMEVGRGGVLPSVLFGGSTHGITQANLRDARRIMAAASPIKAAASSTTVRLAIGGRRLADVDPATTHSNLPLLALSATWWDDATTRADHVVTWRAAKRDIEGLTDAAAGAAVCGPVGAAMMHLCRVGAAWPKPFVVELLDTAIPLLTTPPPPPPVLRKILYIHARRHYDRVLISRLADEEGWQHESVVPEYAMGVDWGMVRDALGNKKGDGDGADAGWINLSLSERRTLQVLVCGAFWPEARRWLCGGMLPTGTCLACCLETGTMAHKASQCQATEAEVGWMNIAGRHIPRPAVEQRFRPLVERGLPPQTHDPRPHDVDFQEGHVLPGSSGTFYGDASGVGVKGQAPKIVTWSILQLQDGPVVVDGADAEAAQLPPVAQSSRGILGGWFPSVPRGELTALIKTLEAGCVPITYAGDCRAVIEGCKNGVSTELTSSRSPMADLWKRVHWLLRDHGPVVTACKIKAHQTRSKAYEEGGLDGLVQWHGNNAADQHAKQLARSRWEAQAPAERDSLHRRWFLRQQLCRAAVVFAIAQQKLDEAGVPKIARPRKRRINRGEKSECGNHILQFDVPQTAWACVRCRLIANTPAARRSLAQKPCNGEVAERIPISHKLNFSSGVLWCRLCGAYTTRLPRALAR